MKNRVGILVIVLIVVLFVCLFPYGMDDLAGKMTFQALLYKVDDCYAANMDTDYQTGIVIRFLGHEVYRNLTTDEAAKAARRE